MINIAATRGAYNNREIDDVGWIFTKCNIEDAFIKLTINKVLDFLLDTRKLQQKIS